MNITEDMVRDAVEAFLANTGQAHKVTDLQRELATTCMRPALEAALSAQPAAVPGGWVLVPKVATEWMIDAGVKALSDSGVDDANINDALSCYEAMTTDYTVDEAQQPAPQSAPVGVEGFDEWFDEYTKNNYTDEMLALAAWQAALAQSPTHSPPEGLPPGDWPDYLNIRDTGLDDGYKHVWTTAGMGYPTVKYIRADLAQAPTLPKLNILCETRSNGITGCTSLNVVRVNAEDDGSFTAVTDYWPPARDH